jgi:hypothetical protein
MQAGHAGRSDWVKDPARPRSPMMPLAGDLQGGATTRKGEGRRSPGGPEAHQEVAGVLGLVGEGRSVANLEVAVLGFPARNGDGGGDSGHGRSIPSVGRDRAARWSWGRSRSRSGRRLAAARGNSHGAELGCRPVSRERESRESESERDERDEREGGVQVPSGGCLGLRRQAGGGTPAILSPAT